MMEGSGMNMSAEGTVTENGRVVWITGAPFAGKTSVATAIVTRLRESTTGGVVHLDGDLLRLVLDRSTESSDSDRRNLGQIYVRLAKSLARQGLVVVVSAVAMYREVFGEFAAEPVCEFEAFLLEASLEIRLARAGITSAHVKLPTPSKDEVPSWVKVVMNDENDTPWQVAKQILDHLSANRLASDSDISDPRPRSTVTDEIQAFGRGGSTREDHWNVFYTRNRGVIEPSSFAEWVTRSISPNQVTQCIDFGCGNGRDSAYLSSFFPVIAVDTSPAAISLAKELWPTELDGGSLAFSVGDDSTLRGLLQSNSINFFYSRFVWHALTPSQEETVLAALRDDLFDGACLAIEARTTDDPLYTKGTRISRTERTYGHYRRFVQIDALLSKLEHSGFTPFEVVEGQDLAQLGDDNPHVVRVLARKFSPRN